MNSFLYTSIVVGLTLLLGLPTPSRAQDKPASNEGMKRLKVVVHINFSDSNRQKSGLKNVRNVLKHVQGEAEVVIVCHGEGIGLVTKEKSQYAKEVEQLIQQKVRFAACENTLREKAIPREQLLPGVMTTPSGAVEVIRRQQEGFGYFKP